jgi:hypothetical protein
MPIVILAHGALGALDEIVFIGVVVVFLAMMALSWFRSQRLTDEMPDDNSKPPQDTVQSSPNNTDRFKLE